MANRLHMDLSINGVSISFTTNDVSLARRVFVATMSVAGEGKKADPASKIQISSNGENRIQVIKAIREITGYGLKEAKDRTEVPFPYAILPEEFTRAGLSHEDTTVGPYQEAVDAGKRFAVIGVKTGHITRWATAEEAAWAFVAGRVGSTRAREAAMRKSI